MVKFKHSAVFQLETKVMTGWWFHPTPLKKMRTSKWVHLPKFRGKHKTMFETTTQKVVRYKRFRTLAWLPVDCFCASPAKFALLGEILGFLFDIVSPTQHMGSDFRIILVTGMGRKCIHRTQSYIPFVLYVMYQEKLTCTETPKYPRAWCFLFKHIRLRRQDAPEIRGENLTSFSPVK